MKTINRISIFSMVLLGLTLLFGGISLASDEAGEDDMGAGKRDVVMAERTTVTAEVKGIDKAARQVTLQTPDGQTQTINVPPEAKNFDQIKIGDKVTMDYMRAVAVDIRPTGASKPPTEKAMVEVAPKGEKPSGTMVRTIDLTAKVEAINPAEHTVTLKGPEGNSRTLDVDPKINLEKIKVGDQVDVRFTEALAIKVTSPS